MKERRRVPFFRSLQFKYAMSFIGIITVVLVLLNTYPVISSQDLVFSSKRDALKSRSSVMAFILTSGSLSTSRIICET